MSDDNTLKLAKGFADALHAVDADDEGALDAMVALFADDAAIENAALDLSGDTLSGKDGARTFWSEYAQQFETAKTEFHHVTADGGAGGLFWTTSGESPSGESLSYHGATLLVFDDAGLVKRFRGYYDTRQLTMRKPAG